MKRQKMGYLSQKKKQANIKELLVFSLGVEIISCTLLLFFPETYIGSLVSGMAFHLYIYTLLIFIFALINRFYWQAGVLLLGVFTLFLIIGQGGGLFFNTQTPGLQELNIMYQLQVTSLSETEKKIKKHSVDIAGIEKSFSENAEKQTPRTDLNLSLRADDDNLIITPHHIIRAGEVLLSQANRAGFAELKINLEQFVFVTLDFSSSTRAEQKIALKNLAEFVNMQDSPVIIIGDFGQEAWSVDFLDFMDKTGLDVKNKIILSKTHFRFNPFVIPSINVLAYKDFGIKEISFLPSKKNPTHPLLIKLNY